MAGFIQLLILGAIIILIIKSDRDKEKKIRQDHVTRNMTYDKQLYVKLKEAGLTEEEMDKRNYLWETKIKKLRDAGMIE